MILQESLCFFISLNQLKSALSPPPPLRLEGNTISLIIGPLLSGPGQRNLLKDTGWPLWLWPVPCWLLVWCGCFSPAGPLAPEAILGFTLSQGRSPSAEGHLSQMLSAIILGPVLFPGFCWWAAEPHMRGADSSLPFWEISSPWKSPSCLSFLSGTPGTISSEGLSFHKSQKGLWCQVFWCAKSLMQAKC